MQDEASAPLSYTDLRRLVLLVAALLVGVWLVSVLAWLLLLFAVVFFLAMVLNPLVNRLESHGFSRGLAVITVLLGLLLVIAGLAALVLPTMLSQVDEFSKNAPVYWSKIQSQRDMLVVRYPVLANALPEPQETIDAISSQASGIVTWVVRRTFGLVGSILLAFIAWLLLLFTLTNPQPLIAGFLGAVPQAQRPAAGRSLARVMHQMKIWLRATLINGAITGVSTGVLLNLAGVKLSLLFGALAFCGEFVPNLGPLVAAIPALFVALGTGPTTFLWALAAILFVQQVETNLLVPYIMAQQLKLHPVTIIFFALAMGTLFNFAGAVLAVPIAVTIKILYEEFYLLPHQLSMPQVEAAVQVLVKEGGWSEGNPQ